MASRRDSTESGGPVSAMVSCRFCARPLSRSFVDLGMSPLCESFLAREQLDAMERFYPAIGRPAFERLCQLLPEIEIAEPADVARSRALRDGSPASGGLPAPAAV